MAEKIRSVTLEELSVSDILMIFELNGHDFCPERMKYLKYGKDLKAAWDAMEENHHDSVCEVLEFSDDVIPEEAIDGLKKLVTKDISKDDIKSRLDNYFPKHWWKKAKTGSSDEQWQLFREALFDYLKKTIADHQEELVMRLVAVKR